MPNDNHNIIFGVSAPLSPKSGRLAKLCRGSIHNFRGNKMFNNSQTSIVFETAANLAGYTHEKYHKERPEIFILFKQISIGLIEKGFSHYSARDILPVIRWQRALSTGRDGFKINNNISPFYARKLMKEDSRFKGFFSLRQSNV